VKCVKPRLSVYWPLIFPAIVILFSSPALSDCEVRMKSGIVIRADKCWEEDGKVYYRKGKGAVMGVGKELVRSFHTENSAAPAVEETEEEQVTSTEKAIKEGLNKLMDFKEKPEGTDVRPPAMPEDEFDAIREQFGAEAGRFVLIVFSLVVLGILIVIVTVTALVIREKRRKKQYVHPSWDEGPPPHQPTL